MLERKARKEDQQLKIFHNDESNLVCGWHDRSHRFLTRGKEN